MRLLLEARDVDAARPLRWRWLLSDDESGTPLADHQVTLDPGSAEVLRFRDLYEFTRQYAAPDRRTQDGAKYADAAGRWAGTKVLGESIGAAIVDSSPVTVRVRVPDALSPVLLWPLELAHVAGRPLAAYGDVTLVYDIAPDAPAQRKAEPGAALRMLAVFSQPTRTSLLALRRERYELTRFVRRIAARERAAVELQVVQYGVTRERLREIAGSDDGWDLLHLSGHGSGGAFLLEKADGSSDPVSTTDLVALLRPARHRLRLAVVSACQSAADTTAQTLRLLGLTDQAKALEAAEATSSDAAAGNAADAAAGNAADAAAGNAADAAAGNAADAAAASASALATQIPGLARAIVSQLDCAVVAMRYPVTDDFAIAFGGALYDHLLSRTHRHTVDVAVTRAVASATEPGPSAARPPVSLVTPAIFGARAVGLAVTVPRGTPVIDPAGQRMAYFPDEPRRFVGRAEAMSQAGRALAPGSGQTAVLLHGMAGAGKTACALELAYRHQDAFAAAAFWQAPTRDEEWASALPDLANRLDIQLADYGFTMASSIGTTAALESFLPRLRRALADNGVLLVLDNLETLLTPEGAWRDPRWALLIAALTSHDGESRTILTSRVVPAGLDAAVVTLPVHALPRDEAVALARELPHLRNLLHADAGPSRNSIDAEADAEADRGRVVRVLHIVQGHPKLLELANAAAADRTRLDAHLAAAEQAATSESYAGQLDAFFRDGHTGLSATQFLDALTGWTTGALSVLSPEEWLMAQFVACLEDADRVSYVIDDNWAELWQRLARPGDPPAPGRLLDALAAAALVEAETLTAPGAADEAAAGGQAGVGDQADVGGRDQIGGGGQVGTGNGPDPAVAYRVHPGVAAAIMAAADPEVREATDAELAAFWGAVSDAARERVGAEVGGLVVRAGLAAAPYLLRRGDWAIASALLERATQRDAAPGTVQAALPSLRRIADATGLPADAVLLARLLRTVDPVGAERRLRGTVEAAAEAGDFWVASVGAGDLANLLQDAGRLGEALEVAGQKAEFTRQAGLGPWTQLVDQALRLQVLGLMGEHARVLAETEGLRAAMAALPARSGVDEAVSPWNVREGILGIGLSSAVALWKWELCLELNAEVAASLWGRGAGAHEVARFRFNDAGPLVRLGRTAEAGRLLAECQRVFEQHADAGQVAQVLSARADLESALDRPVAAADLERAALRLSYGRPEPRGIAVSHHNLANYLGGLGGDRAVQRAHRLGAALIFGLGGMGHDFATASRVLAAELREDAGGPVLPTTVEAVTALAEQTEGVRLAALLAALQPDTRAVEAALTEILRAAAELPPEAS